MRHYTVSLYLVGAAGYSAVRVHLRDRLARVPLDYWWSFFKNENSFFALFIFDFFLRFCDACYKGFCFFFIFVGLGFFDW